MTSVIKFQFKNYCTCMHGSGKCYVSYAVVSIEGDYCYYAGFLVVFYVTTHFENIVFSPCTEILAKFVIYEGKQTYEHCHGKQTDKHILQ